MEKEREYSSVLLCVTQSLHSFYEFAAIISTRTSLSYNNFDDLFVTAVHKRITTRLGQGRAWSSATYL